LGWRKRLFGSGSPRDEPEELAVDEVEEREPNPLEGTVLGHVGEPVSELVNNVETESGVKFEAAARGLERAVEDGKVRLVDTNPPRGLLGYFVSLYSLWFWLVVGFMGVVLASIYVLPQIYPLYYLRYLAGAVFVLFVPGYVLIEALYPKVDELERLERFALDVGLSIAVVPLVGLVLNYTPWGIRLDPIFAALSLLVLGLGLVGVWRKYEYFALARRADSMGAK
jgi:hypothetical protein